MLLDSIQAWRERVQGYRRYCKISDMFSQEQTEAKVRRSGLRAVIPGVKGLTPGCAAATGHAPVLLSTLPSLPHLKAGPPGPAPHGHSWPSPQGALRVHTLRYSSKLWMVTGISFPPFFSSMLGNPGRVKSNPRSSTEQPFIVRVSNAYCRLSLV